MLRILIYFLFPNLLMCFSVVFTLNVYIYITLRLFLPLSLDKAW